MKKENYRQSQRITQVEVDYNLKLLCPFDL